MLGHTRLLSAYTKISSKSGRKEVKNLISNQEMETEIKVAAWISASRATETTIIWWLKC